MTNYILKQPNQLIASIKDLDVKQGIVTGYAAAFNNLDSDGDIILPGAFNKSVKESGPSSVQPRIKHLLNHKKEQPVGLPTLLKEDSKGLYYESQVGTHALGVDFLKMVDSGLITEHSIGYSVVKRSRGKGMGYEDAMLLHELKLMEFSSLTAWGANMNTPLIGVKSLQSIDERINNLVKALSNGTFTDPTFLFLQDELLFLQKAFKDISTKPGYTDNTISPETFKDAISSFTNSLKL